MDPTRKEPCGLLTKLNENDLPLLQMMKTNKLKLTAEDEVLKERKAYREATGKEKTRPNRWQERRFKADDEQYGEGEFLVQGKNSSDQRNSLSPSTSSPTPTTTHTTTASQRSLISFQFSWYKDPQFRTEAMIH